ncbi:MAG: hypothetical protein FWC86_06690, partial [Coriobacteriia bacterium]|nr:hypothetical protein [Coriobacteriia bacterium]
MQSDHKQRNNRNVRVTRKRNNKVSRYLDSYPLPERDNVKPRVISSNPLSTTGSGSPSRQMDSFCPYGSLNYGSPTTSSSSLLYGDLKLRTPHERKLQQERRLSQGIAIG